jgi:hypothetical protein
MLKSMPGRPIDRSPGLPEWVRPQLCKLVDAPPRGPQWLHEIKYDGYRMHARLDRGRVQLLTRSGLGWTDKYPRIAAAVSSLPARQAYLDGELCGVRPDGKTSFSLIQTASDAGNTDALVFFPFDLLYLDGEVISAAALGERKELLRPLLSNTAPPLQFSDHHIGGGPEFYAKVCAMSLEGIVSKRADAPIRPAIAACGSRSSVRTARSSWSSGGPILRAHVRGSERSCWRITIRLGGSFMPGASGRVLTMRSSAGFGVTCSPSPLPRCPSIRLPLGRTGLVHRWC